MILRPQKDSDESPSAIHARIAEVSAAVGASPPGPGWGELLPLANSVMLPPPAPSSPSRRSLNPCGQEKNGTFADGNTCAASSGAGGEAEQSGLSAEEVASRIAAGEKPSKILAAAGWRGNRGLLDETYSAALEKSTEQSRRSAAGALAGVAKAARDMEGSRDVDIRFVTPEQHFANSIEEHAAAEIRRLEQQIADADSRHPRGTKEWDVYAGGSEALLEKLRNGTAIPPALREMIRDSASQMHAFYHSVRGDMTFVADQLPNEQASRERYSDLTSSGATLEHLGYHEMVHASHWRAIRSAAGVPLSGPLKNDEHARAKQAMTEISAAAMANLREAISRRTGLAPTSSDGRYAAEERIARNVSEYATTNPRELVAEYVAGVALGGIDRDKDLDAFVSEMRGPPVSRRWPVSPQVAALRDQRSRYIAQISAGQASPGPAPRALNLCGQEQNGEFAKGNTCAAGGRGASPGEAAEGTTTTSETGEPAPSGKNLLEGSPEFAAMGGTNCPPPCDMLEMIGASGEPGVLVVPEPGGIGDGVGWDEASRIADSLPNAQAFANAIGEYTEGQTNMSAMARQGDLDRKIGTGSYGESIDKVDPVDLMSKYGPKGWVPIEDADDLLVIQSGQEALEEAERAVEKANALHAELVKKSLGQEVDARPWSPSPSRMKFDPNLVYSSVSTRPGVSPDNIEHLPGARPEEIYRLNQIAEDIRAIRKRAGVVDEKQLADRLDKAVSSGSNGWSQSFSRRAVYVSHDEMMATAREAANRSGDFVTQGISIGEFDAALRTVGEGANRAGPIVTWRSAGSSSVGMANSLKAGDIFTGEGFLSTSASPMFAVSWKARELRVLFRIVGRSGAPIERMSRMPGEWEVLYPNSAQFRVASATKDVTVVAGRQEYHGVTVVDLVEIEE